ncbi:KdsC family phosphatase [Pseudomarimonas arenosa]|uniref:3-deoxy-D-manno-octulosonate 8-phosphate phosphatase KdsC n=1 Tax=Pseudomarimonas arenosa TaxID=2774145 RepID=A0AAW3ZQG9_9GAMM|nr:phenylphosphate carboxylase subunit delta [Pseudomarimonas arenosa]MBD8527170.1 phenylphosphate carboxylase subunit delta [Pseudomarimonas arenosa]
MHDLHRHQPPKLNDALREKAQRIRLIGLDIDGTLTNGQLFIDDEGESHKAFHVKDGLGIKLLMQADIEVVWITARRSKIAAARAGELGVKGLIQGCREKRDALAELADQRGLGAEQVGFMGDDLPDLPALAWAGFAAGPADAHWALNSALDWRSQFDGGYGAVREWADLLLLAQGRWQDATRAFQQ